MPRDFDTWNTRENFLSQNPRKASQERFLFLYLVYAYYWRQICSNQWSKLSPKLRSWAPLLVYDATVPELNNFQQLKLSLSAHGKFGVVRNQQATNQAASYHLTRKKQRLIKISMLWLLLWTKVELWNIVFTTIQTQHSNVDVVISVLIRNIIANIFFM